MLLIPILGLLLGHAGKVFSLEFVPYSLPGRLYPSKEYVTVSGNGIGGIMAQMMHFSHSSHIKGCAVYASTFYRCGPAEGSEPDFITYCSKESPLNPDQQHIVAQAVKELQSYNTNHLIDPLGNMRYSSLYVYCNLKNPHFTADQQLRVIGLYERYLESPYAIRARVQNNRIQMRVIEKDNKPNGPSCPKVPEEDGTVSKNCTELSAPAEAVSFILEKYMKFNNPFYPYRRNIYLEPLWSFNQTEFTVDLPLAGLDEVGYYYIPKQCQSRRGRPCLVHVYFHDCRQGREFLGTSHVKDSNYLEIAEMNNIIMLFPQTISSSINPRGCWDYVGWSGALYATKKGQQVQAIWKMLERLLSLSREKDTVNNKGSSNRGYFYGGGGGGGYQKRCSGPGCPIEPFHPHSFFL